MFLSPPLFKRPRAFTGFDLGAVDVASKVHPQMSSHIGVGSKAGAKKGTEARAPAPLALLVLCRRCAEMVNDVGQILVG